MNQDSIIENLKSGKSNAIALLYEYFPLVKNYIIKNSGTSSDAKDVFQESLIILYKKLYKNNFQINSKIETFVFGICKNLWFEELRKRNKNKLFELKPNIEFAEDFKNHIEEENKYHRVDLILNELGGKCLQILQLFYYKNKTMQEIAKILNYKNVNTVKTQKFKCLERARKLAKNKIDNPKTV